MNAILDDYAKYLRATLGRPPESVNKYRSNVKVIMEECRIQSLGDLDPEEINARWLTDIWDIMIKRRGISDRTVKSYQAALKSFFRYLEAIDRLPKGTHQRVELAKPTDVHVEALSKDEKQTLRDYLARNLKTDRERRDAALIFFLWATGCRISEALQINIHAEGFIYTDDPLMRSGDFHLHDGAVYVHINGKGKRQRNIPVTDAAVAYCNLYLDQRQLKSKTLFMTHSRNYETSRLARQPAYDAIGKVFERAGIKGPAGVMTHRLRHVAIEHWIAQGYSPMEIINMTGHASARGLEPYFRRNRELVRKFADAGTPLNSVPLAKDARRFEEILVEKYARRPK